MSPSTLTHLDTNLANRFASMSPAPFSPTLKMSQPQRTSSAESADAIRKRVCKACDRCRLKKSKCDGSHPCSRCKADNAICVFGERKKAHDKIYPKGYVEMLEQQQAQLVSGLQEMYHRLLAGQSWDGPTLSEASGQPLTHDILAALNLLETKHDGSGEMEVFEEDCQKLQSRLLADGAGYSHRRSSISSDSEHSTHHRASSHNTPTIAQAPVFKGSFSFGSASPSPLTQSPVPRQRQSYPPATTTAAHHASPLHQSSPLTNDPQLYQPDWSLNGLRNDPEAILRSKFALQTTFPDVDVDDAMSGASPWDDPMPPFGFGGGIGAGLTSFPQQLSNGFNTFPADYGAGLDPVDFDFNKFIQVAT